MATHDHVPGLPHPDTFCFSDLSKGRVSPECLVSFRFASLGGRKSQSAASKEKHHRELSFVQSEWMGRAQREERMFQETIIFKKKRQLFLPL